LIDAGRPVPQDEYPLARVLKDARYDTCQVGKWRQMGLTPADWGFDEYVTDPTAGGWYWQKSYTQNGQLIQTDEEFYYPDVTHQYAVDFLRRHAPTDTVLPRSFTARRAVRGSGSSCSSADDGWKLNRAGELFDMKDSPFVEQLVPADSKDQAAIDVRARLQAVLDSLNPAGGMTLSVEEEAAERSPAQKQRQQNAKKRIQRKANPRPRAKAGKE
jgi:hypothetical protein